MESDKELLSLLKFHYRDNPIALQELKTVKIPVKREGDLFYLWKWLAYKEGNSLAIEDNYRTGFFNWYEEWSSVLTEVININLMETLPNVNCPVYFFVGANDNLTSVTITEDYFKTLNAPKKELVLFEKSGHGIHASEPIQFQKSIISLLLKDELLGM